HWPELPGQRLLVDDGRAGRGDLPGRLRVQLARRLAAGRARSAAAPLSSSGTLRSMSAVEVLGPKGPVRYGGTDMLTWIHNQLVIASQIMDNPGGGLLFATQTIGQVRAALEESDAERWRDVIALLAEAEDRAVRRDFAGA